MADLRVEDYTIPAAGLGEESPLPPLRHLRRIAAGMQIDADVPEEDRRHIGWGCEAPLLPYHLQDGYDRDRRPRAFRSVVLENETLSARFLPELGGRLWSLVHKPSGRELLMRNPVFQPANLALRNAWFSGGVEWNAAPIPSHHPYTCSPLFTAQLRRGDGAPLLRMYEWERVRRAPFQIDFCLPDGSEFLFVYVRLVNPHEVEIPRYWWSNIAVAETADTRVIVPADSALRFHYGNRLSISEVPVSEGVDLSYPGRRNNAGDAFYRIARGERPWIAAVECDGRGLVQTSTSRLCGRKLFLWGMAQGGRRWQEYLAEPGCAYIEIQAGLARTQRECVPMPASEEWSWTEAYGLLEGDAARLHGSDWGDARRAVSEQLDGRLPRDEMERQHGLFESSRDTPPGEIVQAGSGWGALENARRLADGLAPFCGPGTPYPGESLGPDQALWVALLKGDALPEAPAIREPGKSLTGEEWRGRLERAVAKRESDHWLSWYHLGIMLFDAGDSAGARAAWETSLLRAPSAWAHRCLGALDRIDGRFADAQKHYEAALALRADVRSVAIEALQTALEGEGPEVALRLVEESIAPALRDDGRVRLLRAAAQLRLGRLNAVGAYLASEPEVADVREGEISLTDLWFEYHERRLAEAEGCGVNEEMRKRVRREFPPPRGIDFRMHGA